MIDRDEFTIGNERRLLFATVGDLGRGCKPPAGPGQSPGVSAGAKLQEALTNLHL